MGTVKEEPLSRADPAWLHAEEPTNPFVVTSLAVLDEPLDLDRFKSMLSRRMHLHPRLRQVVNKGLVAVVAQRWTAASNFDLDAHTRYPSRPSRGT